MVPALFANCIPVRGARRALICDVQREQYFAIPLALYELLTEQRGKTMDEILAGVPPEARPVVEEYFEHLFRHGLAWLVDEPECFPPLDLAWDYPGAVSNALIDVGPWSRHDYASLFAQLDDLGCRGLQLRFYVPATTAELEEIVSLTDHGRLRSIEILVPWAPEVDDDALRALMQRHPRVLNVFVHSAPEERVAQGGTTPARIVYRHDVVDSASHCGQVHPAYFLASLPLFTESLRHNSCLNRKVSVDEHGEIRNCPAMPASYGGADRTPLREAVERADFQEVWGVTKDQVETCRDCEFRYICTDCRAFVRDAADPYSKPAKCAYDPYTGTWAAAPAPGQLTAAAGAAA